MKPSKKKKKKKKKKQNQKKKKKSIERPRRFALKPEHGPRGLWRKPLKPDALNQLVGSHRLKARYIGEWVEFSEL